MTRESQAASADLLFPFVFVGSGAVHQDAFQIQPKIPVAKSAGAGIADRVPLRELPVTRRCEEFLLAIGKNFQADRVQWPHLAPGRLVLSLHGLQATNVG